jgi:hypothetical protein
MARNVRLPSSPSPRDLAGLALLASYLASPTGSASAQTSIPFNTTIDSVTPDVSGSRPVTLEVTWTGRDPQRLHVHRGEDRRPQRR